MSKINDIFKSLSEATFDPDHRISIDSSEENMVNQLAKFNSSQIGAILGAVIVKKLVYKTPLKKRDITDTENFNDVLSNELESLFDSVTRGIHSQKDELRPTGDSIEQIDSFNFAQDRIKEIRLSIGDTVKRNSDFR